MAQLAVAKTGTVLTADHEHQCVLCLLMIGVGDEIMAAAHDALTDGSVWVHAQCGADWLWGDSHMPVAFLLSNGWEALQGSQNCFSCAEPMTAGSRAYRVINARWRRYDRICKLCYLKRVMA
jgi:hypothetical protein